ncbi:DNA-binding protein [Nocardia ninae]|uniref:Uncharacterized protein n=1 Tax=Nocardia ninae NBRC 108245 TaxID=1210091 RepID=A0A511MMW0_9NOCA|nr:hypothetical protein [Nocardia ninae]GEM41955.1 hypothetical protein NN4_64740 [Nocardia ninae NBRC 108245]
MPTDLIELRRAAIEALLARRDTPDHTPLPDVEHAVTQALLSGVDAVTIATGAEVADPLELLPFLTPSVVADDQQRAVIELRAALLRGQYDAAQDRLRDVRAALSAEMTDLNANGKGVPETQLATMFRMTRPTIRNFLGKASPNFKSSRKNR